MPSPKTAEKPTETKLINVKAIRKFAMDFSAEELKKIKDSDKHGRDMKGMTKMIEEGETASIPKKMAEILQEAGAVKIVL